MSFADWDSYADLLGRLAAAESLWGTATNFAQFDEKIRLSCPELVNGSGGYDELRTRLVESGDHDDRDLLFEHLRIAALARPAQDYGFGPEWAGYWISKDGKGNEVCADNRGAPPSSWSAVEVPAQDAATAPDLREQHFDAAKGRWRRWNDTDNEFEHYHNDDGIWERERAGSWHRFHDGAGQWLRYDEPSTTWLHQGRWLRHDEITAPATRAEVRADETNLDALAARLVAETLAELHDAEPLSAEELAEAVAMVRHELAAGEER